MPQASAPPCEDGFYWVRVFDGAPQVAEWCRGEWLFTGSEMAWDGPSPVVVSARLVWVAEREGIEPSTPSGAHG